MMFEENFWTHDYISGINVLLTQLKAKISENQRVLDFIRSRVVAERDYSSLLSTSKQINRPESSSGIALAFAQCIDQTALQSNQHLTVSDELDRYCYEPLANISQLYTKNIKIAEDCLRKQYQGYLKLYNQSTKYQQNYSEAPTNDVEPRTLDSAMSTLRLLREKYSSAPNLQQLADPRGHITLAGIRYSTSEAISLLEKLTSKVAMMSYKVALLGTYENVSTGASITSASRRLLRNDSIAYSDKFGQSLVDNGLLKPIAQLSNKFQNSHQSYYQWQPAIFELLKTHNQPSVVLSPPPEPEIERPPSPGLVVESEAYLQSIIELDVYRCNFEQEIVRVYNFLETCELDRITALKRALYSYQELTLPHAELKANMTEISRLKAQLDPQIELANFTRQYRSGPFVPTVAVYQGTNNTVCQTFGVALEKTQFITSVFIRQLQNVDDLPLSAWTDKYKLEDVYKLRSQVNTGRQFNESIFRFFTPVLVCATLKQYYLELPDSLIPFTVYDAAKYTDNPITILRGLNAVHLGVLKEFLGFLRSRYSEYQLLGQSLAHYLFRPRAVSALTMDDDHPAKLITAILTDYDSIFSQLAAAPSTPTASTAATPSPALLVSPLPPQSPQNQQDKNRPRTTSAGSAFETSNGTGLIPLSLSPNHSQPKARGGARLDLRHGVNLYSVLPIKSANNSPTRSSHHLQSPVRAVHSDGETSPSSATSSEATKEPKDT